MFSKLTKELLFQKCYNKTTLLRRFLYQTVQSGSRVFTWVPFTEFQSLEAFEINLPRNRNKTICKCTHCHYRVILLQNM